MNIGVDVDGVLTNLEKFQLEYGKKYFGEDRKIDETQIDIKDIFNCTKEEREKFWIKYIWKYCLTEPARMNSSIVLKKLREQGHKIYIITSRAHVMENNIRGAVFRKMLLYWLDKEEIIYDDITLCHEQNSELDKIEACKKYNIDVMIDDKRENIENLEKIAKVLCFDAKYNQNCVGENIIRVSNYNQVYDAIQRIYNNKYFQKISNKEIEKLTVEEQIKYLKNLKEYYGQLPYDSEKRKKEEKNYMKLCKVAIPIFNSIFKPVVFNRELLPNTNGIIYVANHNNYYDQFPILAALGGERPIHFLTATKMLAFKRGKVYLKTGAISVDRQNKNDRENASEELKKILVNGGNVFIFPEGRTNRKEAFLLEFHPGAVAIAKETGCPIVPIAVNDNYKKDAGDLCVRFGKPMFIDPLDDVIEKTQELKETIGNLKQQNIDYVEKNKIKKL